MANKVRIAHLASSNATIQNAPPLVTSNKARAKYGLPSLKNSDGTAPRFDALRPQRLAAPAKLYVEQFSAHPLESDAAELYASPDGYVDADGNFSKTRRNATDKPVYEIEVRPEDGLYPLPYMGRQSDGKAWEEECTYPGAPADKARQTFFPDGSRSFEEIDRLGTGIKGLANLISAIADVDFYRISPPGGYTKGLKQSQRTDVGDGDIPLEIRGVDFFPYKPSHLRAIPPRQQIAKMTNDVQRIMSSGQYDGAILTEGSPRVEESIYWLNLLIDTTRPICGNAAQRPQGMISNDGPKNIVDSVQYIASRVWEDEYKRDRVGAVLIQEQRIFYSRDVMKVDARPGGYSAAGGHGGIVGGVGSDVPAVLRYIPTMRHTYCSEVNINKLPSEVPAVRLEGEKLVQVSVRTKNEKGELLAAAIPKVSIIKDGSFSADGSDDDLNAHKELQALTDQMLRDIPLSGLIVEGAAPYGNMTSRARARLVQRAVRSGIPVAVVGRGNTEGFAVPREGLIAGSNLTATKARLLLMACLLRFGSLPPSNDPDNPTRTEISAIVEKLKLFQQVFDTH